MTNLCPVEHGTRGRCDREIPDTTFICPDCGAVLAGLLAGIPDRITPPGVVVTRQIRSGKVVESRRRATDGGHTEPGLASALDDAIRRQVRIARSTTSHTPAQPQSDDDQYALTAAQTALPYGYAAAEAKWELRSTLTTWAALISDQRGLPMPDPDLVPLAVFLRAQVEWLRAQAAGPEAFEELLHTLRNARRVIDRPADKRYAGPCTAEVIVIPFVPRACGADLYARNITGTGNDQTVKCRDCGAEYPLAARRDWLLEQAQDRLLPAAEMARAVDGLGVQVTFSTIKSWKRRGRLIAHGQLPDGRPTYRVGDVIDLVEAEASRRSATSHAS